MDIKTNKAFAKLNNVKAGEVVRITNNMYIVSDNFTENREKVALVDLEFGILSFCDVDLEVEIVKGCFVEGDSK
jgi:hypothetical protein